MYSLVDAKVYICGVLRFVRICDMDCSYNNLQFHFVNINSSGM